MSKNAFIVGEGLDPPLHRLSKNRVIATPVRTLAWQSPEFSDISLPKLRDFTSFGGIATPACGLVRDDI